MIDGVYQTRATHAIALFVFSCCRIASPKILLATITTVKQIVQAFGMVVLINIIGPMAYFVFGRKRGE
jgi:ABC-type methionine transport system permease subunit